MITEPARPTLMRYAGALLNDATGAACSAIGPNGQAAPTGLTVGIPLRRGARRQRRASRLRGCRCSQEIRAAQDADCPARGPFSLIYLASQDECGPLDADPLPDRGLAAVRINYPYQAAVLSGFLPSAPSDIDPLPPNVANPIAADDGGVQQNNVAPGAEVDDGGAIGPYTGPFGLGRQLGARRQSRSPVSKAHLGSGDLSPRGRRMKPFTPRRPGAPYDARRARRGTGGSRVCSRHRRCC